MKYAIDVLDGTKTRVAELTGMVSARLHEKVNTPSLLVVETVEERVWDFIDPGVSFLRLREVPDTVMGTFRVLEVCKSRVRERPGLTATARHILGDTADELFADAVDCINYTPAELAGLVLGHSAYGAGMVEPMVTVPFVRFEYEPVLDCLLRVCALCGGELALDEATGEIDILTRVGEDTGATFRYGVNLTRASRKLDVSRLANCVYGVGGGNPPLDLRGASSSGGLRYAENAQSIADWGLREAAFHEPTLEDTVNLVAAPALDGVYTGGLCENWTNMSAAVSKNTNPCYYLYGLASQRVQSSAAGQGISQDMPVTSGRTYSLLAHVFIASGTVRVQVEDGAAVYMRPAAVTGSGLAVVRIENWKMLSSTVMIKLMQEGTGTADFYVDSVQIAEGARTKPFTVGKSADTLWDRTVEYLNAHKDPEITYEVELADLYGSRGAQEEAVRFGLGDTVRVVDPVLGLDVSTRVMEREADILRPGRVRVKLDNPVRGLADVLAALRNAQEEALRRTRSAFAESSTAAETGSTRLGFSNQSFRFFASITATGWNSLSWSAGTLRIGDAWFSINSNTVSSLAGSSTYFFYFDRGSPTTFGYTTTHAQAEGEDRILIFAVTTTSSPEPCVIHPMGIIHG